MPWSADADGRCAYDRRDGSYGQRRLNYRRGWVAGSVHGCGRYAQRRRAADRGGKDEPLLSNTGRGGANRVGRRGFMGCVQADFDGDLQFRGFTV